jgi:uncharacterized damage-inducible protein DinB
MALRFIVGTFALALTFFLAGCGGGTTPTGEPAPADTAPASAPAPGAGQASVLGDLLKDWQNQKDTLMKIADAMPENKFGYKSTPAQRTYGEQVMHVALVNVDLLKVIKGAATPPSFTAESAKTKADILKALDESYDYGAALLKEQTDATITGTVDASFLGPSTRARVFWALLAHSMDIYGQMAVYLRLNGIVPPASRGV